MTKTRMNNAKREILNNLIRAKVVKTPANEKALRKAAAVVDKAQARLEPHIVKKLEKKYPPADMTVLAKYGSIRDRTVAKLSWPNDNEQGRYGTDQIVLSAPVPVPSGVGSITFLIEGQIESAYLILEGAQSELTRVKQQVESELRARRQAYFDLILGSRNYEDIIDVWPEAAEIYEQIAAPGTSLTVVSDETKKAIAADMAVRKAA